ncbi:crotonase/enoyl-CoA hydratase family protein [Falsihalocynthiibacter arcticus]|uniref:Enoyl-CoA hydratase n=1 Tax=Falsihalocynthiibacter arcticus TaxID=1579316 RepID=A0A126UW77_9RHOB|nr:crotonase/enoyl-CoA hydratase family protein [Falsihalocynthiibacter arcticus]AML50300.1 enoyl-CoA hydratase [Falsihalocynthiibacter arcticus]
MSERVSLSMDGPVAVVALCRPEKRNALDLEMIQAIVETGEALMDRKDIRAVVLCGDGPSFCAGLDTSTFGTLVAQMSKTGGITARTHGDSNLFQRATMVWRDLPMPVIAAVHGHVYGGGFQIMLGADMRIARPDSKFSIREGKWGLIPDMGGMALLPQLARADLIRKYIYSAEVFDGNAALNAGFITEINDDPKARALEIACDIATKNPDAICVAKELITEIEHASVPDVLMAESVAQAKLLGTPNQMEAIMAGLEGRKANYKDPA